MSVNRPMKGRLIVKPDNTGWVDPNHYSGPVPEVQQLLGRVKYSLMWMLKRYVCNFGYWTRENLR